MISTPCKGCEKRAVRCHVMCEEYIEFKKDVEKYRESEKKYKINRSAMFRPRYYKL